MLKAVNISKKYGDLEVLKDVTMEVDKGEIVAIVGKSGSGKTTLLHILGTLDSPNTGSVWLEDIELNKLNPKDLAKARNEKLGFIFQFHHLLAEFTALENVMIPLELSGRRRQARRLAAEFGEGPGHALDHREPHDPAPQHRGAAGQHGGHVALGDLEAVEQLLE